MRTTPAPVVLLESITKAYPGVVANSDISVSLERGEIHTILGQNGAGKTTLMGILYGLHHPDAGRVLINGTEVNLRSPRDALAAGIGYVQQNFSLIPTLTVLENLVLSLHGGGRRVRIRDGAATARNLSAKYGISVDPDALVRDLSVGEQQRVELLKALALDSRVLILDEPGAVLTPQETRELGQVLRRLAEDGLGIFLISHKLDEVLRISDRITVLREGRLVGTLDGPAATANQLGEMMVGQIRMPDTPVVAETSGLAGETRLEADNLWIEGDRGGLAVEGVTLRVRAGEIVGIAGMEGNGQVELTEGLAGVRAVAQGTVRVDGRPMVQKGRNRARRAPIGHVPSDRNTVGLVKTLSIEQQLALPFVNESRFSWFGLLRRSAIRRHATYLIERFDIRTAGPWVLVEALSGGNQQKVILARELAQEPAVLICCYATRGLDFAATAAVQQEVLARRNAGSAVLYASVDLDELLSITDRIIVIAHGKLVGELPTRAATAERLGMLMGGAGAS